MRFCISCGSQIPPGSGFCTKCGTPATDPDQSETCAKCGTERQRSERELLHGVRSAPHDGCRNANGNPIGRAAPAAGNGT